MADPWNTTYAPAGSWLSRNAGDGSLSGLSPTGQQGMGAFGRGMAGAGASMMSPAQKKNPLWMGAQGLHSGLQDGGAFQPPPPAPGAAPSGGGGGGGLPFGPFSGLLPLMMGMGKKDGSGGGGGFLSGLSGLFGK